MSESKSPAPAGVKSASRTDPLPMALALGVIGLLFVVMNAAVMKRLFMTWVNDSDFTHGFFVPVIAVYFIWDRREELAEIEYRPSFWGLALLVGSILLRIMSIPTEPLYTQALSMVLMLGGLVWYLGGTKAAAKFAFPIAFLVLMIPLPGVIFTKIAVFLQHIATASSAVLLNLLGHWLGIVVNTSGNVIELTAGGRVKYLEVARACSGIRSLVGLVTMGVAFSYVVTRYLWERVVIVASTIPIAIFCNMLRVTITALLYARHLDRLAEGFLHQFEGMVMFAVALGMLFCVERVLKLLIVEEAPAAPGSSEAQAG